VSGVAAIALVTEVWGVFLSGLLMVPIAAGMVWPDRILDRWSEARNRAYSVREVVILEAGLLAVLCMIAWVLKRFGGVGVGWVAAVTIIALIGLRWAFKRKSSESRLRGSKGR
jgi:hypothetical protein